MAVKAHKLLTGSDLHEPKGVASATAGQIYVADGLGSGTWKKVTSSEVDSTANPFGAALLHVRDEKTSNTAGGTPSVGSNTRVLNTVKTNEISGASLASNQISLPAGTYFIEASAPGATAQGHVLTLYNVSDAATTLTGQASYSNTNTDMTHSAVRGRFTIAGTKTFELRHLFNNNATNGLGYAVGRGTEVYAEALIWKLS